MKDLQDPTRKCTIYAKCCPLFMKYAKEHAEKEGLDLSKYLRMLVLDKFTEAEKKKLAELRAHL